MDTHVFYDEIKSWIDKCNQKAVELGMHSHEFWSWVTMSIADISERYDNNELVKKQMVMLYEWLHDIYQKGVNNNE